MNTEIQKTLIAGALLSLSSVAQAGWQHYGGAQCQPAQPTDGTHMLTSTSGIANAGTQTIYVTCPVVRQRLFSTNGVQQAYAVVKSNGTNTLSCTFANLNNLSYAYSKTAGTSSANVTSLDVRITQSNPSGHYAISCAVPPGGRIIHYWINEYDQ